MPLQGSRGLDLIKGELGSLLTVVAAGATAGVNGAAYLTNGERSRFIAVLDLTAAATDVDDTLDVYLDTSIDGGTSWLNSAHFTQCLGNGGTNKFFAVLDPTTPGTAVLAAATDCAVSVVRPSLVGDAFRGRYVIVDPAGANAAFSFTLKLYAMGGRWG